MCEYDILVCVKFLSHEKGGRQYLSPIKNSEYTYRPIFKLEKKEVGYCCGVVIGNYIQNYAFDIDLYNVRVGFLEFSQIRENLSVGDKFSLCEGFIVVATGRILKIINA